jgi:hypothetical protein
MFKLHFDKKQNCLIGVYDGMYTRETFRACVEKVRPALEAYSCHRFAMDMRHADMDAARVDFEFCYTALFEAGLDESWKKAILLSGECYAAVPDKQKPCGHPDMNLYADVQQAAKWLFM